MTLVVDASVVVAAILSRGPDGQWARQRLAGAVLAAPHLMPAEATNVLRRAASAGQVSGDSASLALNDLVDLRVELFPFAPYAVRIWQLRENVSSYDAWYVAVAEDLDAPLLTLDARLAASSGPRCRFELPVP